MPPEGGVLACPSCGLAQPEPERFCPACGMPLTPGGLVGQQEPRTRAQERARKVHPPYAEGQLVKVAGGRNQAEAELIQGLLLEEGVPSMLRRSRGFDVPDMLAAGPRDVLVPQAGAQAAREVLLEAELLGEGGERVAAATPPARLLAGLLAATAVVALVVWAAAELGA